jgi:hypothetical protein
MAPVRLIPKLKIHSKFTKMAFAGGEKGVG